MTTRRSLLTAVFAAGAAVGCLDELGELAQGPELPESATPPLFSVPDASPPPPLDASSSPTVPTPTSPHVNPQPPVSIEPSGRAAVTLMHGVVDAAQLSFCLKATTAEGIVTSPRPVPEQGLQYGEAVVVSLEALSGTDAGPNLIAGDFAGSVELLPIAIAAEPSLLAGSSCAELLDGVVPDFAADKLDQRLGFVASSFGSSDAGLIDASVVDASDVDASVPAPLEDAAAPPPLLGDASPGDAGPTLELPPLRIAELPTLPLAQLEAWSYLLVASGCMGAPALAHEHEALLCGPRFVGSRNSFTGVFVPLSRATEYGAVGLQVTNASQAFPLVTLRSNPLDSDGVFFILASNIATGAIEPSNARRSVALADYGPLDQVQIEVTLPPQSDTLFAEPWAVVLERSGLQLRNGHAYTLVLLGPVPGIEAGAPWNPPRFALVRNDPLRPID